MIQVSLKKVAREAKQYKQPMDYDNQKGSGRARSRSAGQTLVALLFFVMVGLIVTVAATIILSTNSLAAQKLSQGEVVRQMAETGAENALLRLLRDKTYPGETLTNIGGAVGDNVVIIVSVDPVTGQKAIFSTATSGNLTRKVEVVYTINDVLTPLSWKEIY